jgi:Tfp pilus assembly protein PilV
LQEALNKKDTSAALTYANDVIEEFYNYRQETIYQDSIQDGIIEKQAATISNTTAEAELQAIKYDKLKTAYSAQSIALNEATQQNNKLQKKLKRAKFWGKVAGIGTAAGVVLAGFVFL